MVADTGRVGSAGDLSRQRTASCRVAYFARVTLRRQLEPTLGVVSATLTCFVRIISIHSIRIRRSMPFGCNLVVFPHPSGIIVLLSSHHTHAHSHTSFPGLYLFIFICLVLSFLTLSSFVTPHIHRSIHMSVTSPSSSNLFPVLSLLPVSRHHTPVPVSPLSRTHSLESSHSFFSKNTPGIGSTCVAVIVMRGITNFDTRQMALPP